MSKTVRVLVADAISERGIELLRQTPGFEVDVKTGMSPEQLRQTLGDYHALIVRSATKVTADVLAEPGQLRAVGRAGTGVDNIDLPAATKAGVVVMNTPGGNSVAAAELSIALLMALARNVPQANADLREGRWERKRYMGTELCGKRLGVVGLGRIGREVARRAQGLRMETLGYDPYVSADMASDFGVRFLSLEELVAESDFISLHIPRTNETRHLIDRAMLARMKPGARLINCARGGLVDEDALLEALDSEQLSGAALDVFEEEPPSNERLLTHPKIVSTPHLGASTREAQERVGTEIAEKIRDYIQKGVILDAVNFPSIARQEYAELGPAMQLAECLGSFLGQVTDGGFKRLEVRTLGTLAAHTLKPIVMAAAKGLLSPLLSGAVSYVNSLTLATDRGITVDEARSNESSTYAGLIRLTLETGEGSATVAGTLFAPDNRPRLVEVDGVPVEANPQGHMLFFRNRDVPGVVGQIGTTLGKAGINIAGIQLGRLNGTDRAVSIINVDAPVPGDVLQQIGEMDAILTARLVTV